MKKSLRIIIIGLVLIGIVVTLVMAFDKKDGSETGKDGPGNAASKTIKYGVIDACRVLDINIAEKVLGVVPEKAEKTPDSKSGDVNVSSCSYATPAFTIEEVKTMRIATVVVRSPLSNEGAEANQAPFDKRSAGAVDVQGYGASAYWDPSLGQLNVLKEGAWYLLSIGTNRAPERTIEDAKSMATTLGLQNGI
jgi:hypothetical protein